MNELFWFVLMVMGLGSTLLAYRFFGRQGLYCLIPIAIISANIMVLKTIVIFGLTATLGNIAYSATFLVTDILSENHSARDARRGVLIGFLSLVLFTLFMQMGLLFVPASVDFAHESMTTLFSILPRITIASLTAYLFSQYHDVWAFSFWRRIAPNALWLRNNASTAVSQIIDSVLFVSIAFVGLFPLSVLWEIALTTYLLKVLVAVIDTPCIYLARRIHRAAVANIY